MPALRLSLTGRHALFVNKRISGSGNAEARKRKGKRDIGRGGDRTAAGG
jgi:hypothetical protein